MYLPGNPSASKKGKLIHFIGTLTITVFLLCGLIVPAENAEKLKSTRPGPDQKNGKKSGNLKPSRVSFYRITIFFPVAMGEDPNQFYVVSLEDTDPRKSIKLFDMETLSYVKTVYEHPEFDVAGAVTDTLTGKYAGAFFYDDRLQYALSDQEIQKHVEAINAHFDEKANVKLVGWSTDRRRVVVYVTAYDIAGSYYIYDVKERDLKLLIHARSQLQSQLNSDARILNIATRDGQSITAYHYFPKNKRSRSPLLVMPHGGPHAAGLFRL